MRKVLIIPSWYPTATKPIEGSFFREQALAMKALYDVKIFYPQRIKRAPIIRLYDTISFLLKREPTIKFLRENFMNDPEVFSFCYSGGIGRLKLEEKILEWECNAAFNKLIVTGWKPDLIHAQCTSNAGIIGFFISKKFKLPYIITEHNIFLLHLYPLKIQGLMKKALENAQKVIAVSEHQKKLILMQNIDCRPVVVGNMIDENIFCIDRIKHKSFTILFISYDHYIKDNRTFFKAISLFKQQSGGPFTVNLLARNIMSEREDTFVSLVNEYDLGEEINIRNTVARNEIVRIFQGADVLVSTSIAETFGISMCEALFCGVPIISTANGGVDEMINDYNGIKVKIQDEAAICEALLKIYNREIIFDSEAIRESVIDKFSKDTFIRKMDYIYRSVPGPQQNN